MIWLMAVILRRPTPLAGATDYLFINFNCCFLMHCFCFYTDQAKQRAVFLMRHHHYLLAYILSATFEDCLILIRGHEDNVKNVTHHQSELEGSGTDEVGEA